MYVCYFIFRFISVDLFKYYTLGLFFFFLSFFFFSFLFRFFFTFPFKMTGLQASVYQAPEQPNWIFLLALAVFIFYSRLIPLQRAGVNSSAPRPSKVTQRHRPIKRSGKQVFNGPSHYVARPELWSLRSFAPKFRPEMNCRRLWYFGSRGAIMPENNADAGAVCSGAGARGDNKRRRWCDGFADKGRRASGSLSQGRRRQADRLKPWQTAAAAGDVTFVGQDVTGWALWENFWCCFASLCRSWGRNTESDPWRGGKPARSTSDLEVDLAHIVRRQRFGNGFKS